MKLLIINKNLEFSTVNGVYTSTLTVYDLYYEAKIVEVLIDNDETLMARIKNN